VAVKVTIALLAPLLVAGCAWNALYVTPSVAPVQVALTDFKKPYPGKYLLLVSSAGLNQKVEVEGLVCTSHDFFIEIERNFEQSVQKTLANGRNRGRARSPDKKADQSRQSPGIDNS